MASDEELVARVTMIADRAWTMKRALLQRLPAEVQKDVYCEAVCAVVCLLMQQWQIEDSTAQQVAMRRIDDVLQREWRHYQREGTSLSDEDEGDTDEPAREGSPEELEMQMDVRDALARLPAELRPLALLRFCYGCKEKDIAAMQGIALRTVERRIATAREQLQRWLAAYRYVFSRNPSQSSRLSDSTTTPDQESCSDGDG